MANWRQLAMHQTYGKHGISLCIRNNLFMRINHTDGLKKGVYNGTSYKLHASFFRSFEMESERVDVVFPVS